MNRTKFLCCIVLGFLVAQCPSTGFAQDDSIFSGPQDGEEIVPFKMSLGFGDNVGANLDVVGQAGGGPVVIMFVHKRSRTAFGLANAMMRYCVQQKDSELTSAICFLTDDRTETEQWLGRIKHYFPKNSVVGISSDGAEGPGDYGLNRNVELTIVIGKENKVTGNFALIQPSLHGDGPKILKSIAKTLGRSSTPDINDYLPTNQANQDAPIPVDPKLKKLVDQLSMKEVAEDEATAAMEKIQKMVANKESLKPQLARLANQMVRSGRIENIKDESHRKTIRGWADYQRNTNRANNRLSKLLRPMIQKSASQSDVDKEAAAIEKLIENRPRLASELGRICQNIVSAGKLENYGTEHAQLKLQEWAKKYGTMK